MGTRTKKRVEEPSGTWLDVTSRLLKGSVVALLATMLCLFLGACTVSFGWLKQEQIMGAVSGACVLGGLIGGLVAVRRKPAGALFIGLGVGVILFFVLMTAGMLMHEGSSLENGGIGIFCACACGGAIAGIFGRKRKKKHKR